MEQYNLTDVDVQEVLLENGLTPTSFCKLPKSGQRQVFEVTFDTGNISILKFVDISPYFTFQRLDWNEISEEDFDQERDFEVEARSKRIIRELEASKKCAILPQLEILDDFKVFKKDKYLFIYYFETRFEGQTLDRSEVYQRDQGIEAVIGFLIQMVKQIKIMNDAGYVHRDLTPRNIIYNHGQFKIIDAGLVKSNQEEKLTGTKMQIGTPYYMAPEQVNRTPDYTWDFRTDLFPLGLIAIEIFLPKTRHLGMDQIRDLHSIFQFWKMKDSSAKSVQLFSKVISRLAVEQRHRRWADLDELLVVLEHLTGEEEMK